jgi:hypothetical protein
MLYQINYKGDDTMNLEQIIDVIVNNGYEFSYNETLGNFEFSNNDEVISIYDTGNEKTTISEIKKQFSFLFK